MNLDVLIFAAHPDDAELSMGGTIAKFSSAGIKTGVIDMTEAEMSTRGTVESRKKERQRATEILKIDVRESLNLSDGGVKFSEENVKLAVEKIRKFRPIILFAPYYNDRHPDHVGAAQIAKEAFFFSGLAKYETGDNSVKQEAYRPSKLFYFFQTYETAPSFITDISGFYERKMEAVKAYSSQFYNPESREPETFISNQNFILFLEARAKYYGFKIGKNYGEPFFCEENIEYDFKNLLI